MKRRDFLVGAAATTGLAMASGTAGAFPTVFPHGVTLYKPEKCWNGFTVFGVENKGQGSVLIDMNGNIVKQWKHLSDLEHPVKGLEGGYFAGATNPDPNKKGRTYNHPDSADLSVIDFEGKIVRNIPLAGMHHDYTFGAHPTSYYTPEIPLKFNPNDSWTVLSHLFTEQPKITDKKPLDDDYIFEVDKDNNIIWDWLASDYFDQMNFDDEFKACMYKYPNWIVTRTPGVKGADWIHTNSMSYLGPNHWYESDPVKYAALNPENIIISNRQTNTSNIIDKKTKNVVWQIGPYHYQDTPWEFAGESYPKAAYKLGQMVGNHHTHMIPKGLPGAGNILIYDNGGFGGYGARTPTSPFGINNARRDYSRVVEFNPVTLEIVWEHSARTMGLREVYKFYSDYVSSAQRLPNGNTLITNGAVGQLQEVTYDHEVVWEYISPWYNQAGKFNLIYRAYRLPYSYVPQLQKGSELAVTPPDNATWRLPTDKK